MRPRALPALASAIALAAIISSAALAQRATPPPQGVAQAQLRQFWMPDPYLGMPAWTFVAPADWQLHGGVVWTGRLLPLAYYTDLRIDDPRGQEEVRLFPSTIFVETANPMLAAGREIAPVPEPVAFVLRILIPRYRPEARGSRVIGQEPRVQQLEAEAAARARTQGIANAQFHAGRILVEYPLGASTVREMFYATIAVVAQPGARVWTPERVLSVRVATKDYERRYPLLGLVASSLRENPQWVAARGHALQQLVARNSPPPASSGRSGPSILDVSKSMSAANDQFLRNVDQIHQQRLNSPGLDGWTRAFRGTTTVENPVTGQRQDVQGGYLRYYQDYAGRIYGSNDQIDDLYTRFKIGGVELGQRP